MQILDEFNKLTLNLANCEEDQFFYEHFAVILLNSLPESYKDVKNAIKYGRDEFSYDIVVSSLRSRELELKSEIKEMGEGLIVRGRIKNRN